MTFERSDAWALCAALNGSDPVAALPQIRALVLKLLGTYIQDVRHEAPITEVVYNADPSVAEWLTKDGWRWLARDNMNGYGPSLSAGLAVLDILDSERGSLDPTQLYHFAKWVWRQE